MLIKILLALALVFCPPRMLASGKDIDIRIEAVKTFLDSLNNVSIDFQQIYQDIKNDTRTKNRCKMYIAKKLNNRLLTKIRLDYRKSKGTVLMDKDTTTHHDNLLKVTYHTRKESFFFRFLTANSEELQKDFVSAQSDNNNFVFYRTLSNGKNAVITLHFTNSKKLHHIIIEHENDSTYTLNNFTILKHFDEWKFSQNKPNLKKI